MPTSNPPAPTNDSINNVPSYEPLQPQKPLYKPSPMNNNVNQTKYYQKPKIEQKKAYNITKHFKKWF